MAFQKWLRTLPKLRRTYPFQALCFVFVVAWIFLRQEFILNRLTIGDIPTLQEVLVCTIVVAAYLL